MASKEYDWDEGAHLDDHSKRKHKILREYFFQYVSTRCQIAQQTRFRMAVVDGFAGAGRYKCGSAGSPIIFIEELKRAFLTINIRRAGQGLPPMEIECLFVFNDALEDATEKLKANTFPLLADIKDTAPGLKVTTSYLTTQFETAYPQIKALLAEARIKNAIFNLDQYGAGHVHRRTLFDILQTYNRAEIFYTFAINALFAFLSQTDPQMTRNRLGFLGLDAADLSQLDGLMNKNEFLGATERLVFDAFGECAPYVSPFSIHNPNGWRYWLIHMAMSYRARQVYNNVLHDNSSSQAHFGRAGLKMLSFDPSHDTGSLYLFDKPGREKASEQLYDDIPRVISETGDAIQVMDFYEDIYNTTPAHADDINKALIQNPDILVTTPAGGLRRRANTIEVTDIIKLNPQKSFFPMFSKTNK